MLYKFVETFKFQTVLEALVYEKELIVRCKFGKFIFIFLSFGVLISLVDFRRVHHSIFSTIHDCFSLSNDNVRNNS